jgi:hypothetical protein
MVAEAPVVSNAKDEKIAAMTKVVRTRMTPTPSPLFAAVSLKQLTIASGSPKINL